MASHTPRRHLSDEARQFFRGDTARGVTAKTCIVRQDAHFINWGRPKDGEFKVDQREICAISLALKSEPDKWQHFYVGRHVGQKLVELAGQKLLPLSDLSKSFNHTKVGKTRAHIQVAIDSKNLTPLNKELINALDILTDLYGIIPREGAIFKRIKNEIEEHPERDVSPHMVRNFDIALSRCRISLDGMLADLKNSVPNPRDFSFPRITDILKIFLLPEAPLLGPKTVIL